MQSNYRIVVGEASKSYSHLKRKEKRCNFMCFFHEDGDIRGLERCSRVYPVKALGNSSMLC